MSTPPRPLFIYGTLRALPLLAWAITGDESQVDAISGMLRKGRVQGYKRCSVRHCDYPAAIKDDNCEIDGYLLLLETTSQRRKLDNFEGETYMVTPVAVSVENHEGGETIDADMYVWNRDNDALSSEPWDLEWFIKERLEDWLDLFRDMELVDEEEE
ncbi:hypothetical protein B0T16DRAFT_403875 [Cercophora newfieldiana]|uniref:Putative gamma-glutamylcyclotransferase n=1 Tax=Cercophora newfieldiana TaxID=92897 RepID=A0AA40CW60_9PEZI|nr:hypothetical protein B0T16DRAFT_403875 [Cercophora newfieldiana]